MSFGSEKIDYGSYEKPSDFIKFNQGDTRIRVVSDGYLLRRHQFKHGGRFITIPCVGRGCSNCEKAGPPVLRYAWVVLNRETEQVRVLEAGVTVGEALISIGKEKDLRTVDLIITRKGHDKGTKYKIREAEESEPISDEVKEDILIRVPLYMKKYIKDV